MAKSVYIHIPFCKQKCFYCDFNSFAKREFLIDDYMKALYKERTKFSFDDLDTIYIGGGTPSIIDEKYIENILSMLPKAKEVTIEMNPCTVTKEKLICYKNAGVNRISMGLQTTNDVILKEIGRAHSFEDFEKAFKLIKEIEFENVNIDLMFGLPKQNIEDVKNSLNYLISLEVPHISCYSLIVHENIFNDLPSDEVEREMYHYICNTLKENGYLQYEISNFSKIGFESRHNLAYWNQKEYVGLGAGASSYINDMRYTNECDIEKYISKIKSGEEIRNIEEKQNQDVKLREYIILRLRLMEGVSIQEVKKKFNTEIEKIFSSEIEKLIKLKLIEFDKGYIRLTEKGMDLANIVWEEFV